jgi:hypothetical protein
VRRVLGRDVARAGVAERAEVEVAEESLAGAEEDGRNREVQLVDEALAQ